jgi:hypothetical protein
MAKQNVDIGVEGNDGTGDSIRESFRKVNENFTELYAVFGIGGQISFTDLSDTPSTYQGNENKVPAVAGDGSGMNLLQLASNNALDGTIDTIGFDYSVSGKLIIRQLVSKVSNDPIPVLGGPLDAATQPIANVAVTQAAIDTFNAVHNTQYTVSDLVINKAYADSNYQTKDVPGGGIRLADEPSDASAYTITITSLNLGNMIVNNHGLPGSYTGSPFVWTSTGTDPTNVTTGQQYFIRVIDANTLSFHSTSTGAIAGTGRLLMSGGSGTFTIRDAAYDSSLSGNWLNNVALPRKSVVRRQGDTMTGALNLFDHPGELSGKGTPYGPDDLQAVSKLYVDNVAATSDVNIFVTMKGDDTQRFTPDGKQGRAIGYAYKTINAASRKAEEIIISAPPEPGPYMQTLTYNTGVNLSTINTAGITSPISGRTNARTLIINNKEFVAKEVTAYMNATYPDHVGDYNEEDFEKRIEEILDSVSLDSLLGNNANFLSRYAGLTYYASVEGQTLIGTQKTETVAGITYAKNIVKNYILTNTAVPTSYQTQVTQFINGSITPDATADDAIDAKFQIVLDVINNGALNAPQIVDGTTTYKINANNGNFGFLDQANPNNTDVIPGKVIRGKTSGAIGLMVDYKHESGSRAVSIATTDEIELQLLKPIEFIPGEELEYGNVQNETQVVIVVESGIYDEDFPIKVPNNVSIRGDEQRRVIVRPKNRISQSRYADTYFYRDAEFDGMVLGVSEINTLRFETQINSSRTAGTYTVTSANMTTSNIGTGATLTIIIDSNGAVTSATPTVKGKNFVKEELITIEDSQLGSGGAPAINITVDTILNGDVYKNPLTGTFDGYFGYHYLEKPGSLKNIGAGYTNVGNWETSALTFIDNKEFIQEQVVNYIETTYPSLPAGAVYSRAKWFGWTGQIVDAIIKDLRLGGNEFVLQEQGDIYQEGLTSPNLISSVHDEWVAGVAHIYTMANKLLQGQAPSTLYNQSGGTASDRVYAQDLTNGDSAPATWTTGKLYKLQDVVKFTSAGVIRYYVPKLQHTSGVTFDATEIATYWTEIDTIDTTILNFINSVNFAFNTSYNPPKHNRDQDVFLLNDATILRNMTVQGHGGFMGVLDPDGQILTKSPYIQTGSSFAASLNKQAFRGGLYTDAFVGNSAIQVTGRVSNDPFTLNIKSLGSQSQPQGLFVRKPQTPCAFYIDGRRFQVNAITNYDKSLGTAILVLDRSSNSGTGFTGTTSELITGFNLTQVGTFQFEVAKCERDTGYILDAVQFDLALGTNYNAVTNGLAYQRNVVSTYLQSNQKAQTIAAIQVTKAKTAALSSVAGDATALSRSNAAFDEIIDILDNGALGTETAADTITFSAPSALPYAKSVEARTKLQENRTFLGAEAVAFINLNSPAPGYDEVKCARDVRFIIDAITYDINYGGNTASRQAARSYIDDGVAVLAAAEVTPTVNAMNHIKGLLSDIVNGVSFTKSTGNAETQVTAGLTADATTATQLGVLIDIIINVIQASNLNSVPAIVKPSITWATAGLQAAHGAIDTNRALIIRQTVQSVASPIDITLQTAGNRSMLGNDFTQINDLGYGLVAVNGGISEMVSMFTYYCHVSYYSKNGSQIRSLTGSSCYGEFGLVAEGSDPNEIPDAVSLAEDMVMPGKIFSASVILQTTGPVVGVAGETFTQASTGATGVVVISTGANGNSQIYLRDTTGSFDTTNTITGSTTGALGANSVPLSVDATGYTNAAATAYMYVYDMKDVPSNRSEFDIYHTNASPNAVLGRYEVSNVELATPHLGAFNGVGVGGTPPITATQTVAEAGATGARFQVRKTKTDGYTVVIKTPGTDYRENDTFLVTGDKLGGATPANDATITVTQVDAGDSTPSTGAITGASISGTALTTTDDTPTYSGAVYKLNFSTSSAQYAQNGIVASPTHNDLINYRRNETHIFNDLAQPDLLTIRPSTAVLFNENPGNFYRSISFLTSNSLGTTLGANSIQAGFDSGYDYIRLTIDNTRAAETALSGTGTTKGATAGDVRLALQAVADANEKFRLNNNARTPEAYRPVGWSTSTLTEAPIISWKGKKHYVYNYRGVTGGGAEQVSASDDVYAIVDLAEVGETINSTNATGIHGTVVLSGLTNTIRAGLQAGATGTVTVNISTCRATGHDFLDIGTGGFNASNYPNFIFGPPGEKSEANEVVEKNKGRVFFVSTDQNGIFKVGKFFQVDQGTGTVTFSASIALSDVDGLGFKRGVVITEFSTDTAMTDNASDTVPTEGAVRGYVNRRLGYDVNGTAVSNKLGPGVLAPNGVVPMTGDLNAASNTITNLKAPAQDSDAATKVYVDNIAGSTSVEDLRSSEYNDYALGNLFVATGEKKLIINAGSIVSGPFVQGQTISGNNSGATGTIVDLKTTVGVEGNVIEITYTPVTGTFQDGLPAGSGESQDVVSVVGGAQGTLVKGPIDVWANGITTANSDISFTPSRNRTIVGGVVTDRHVDLDVQIKVGTIVNADVNGAAQISQSKLAMNSASTRINATNISQADLGVVAFDSDVFTTTNGWTTISDGQLDLKKIKRVSDGTVLGNWSGDSSDNDIDEISFATVVSEGGGIGDADLTTTIAVGSDPGEAVIKTGTGTYAVSNVTKTGEVNSIIKSDLNGSIQVNSLILGGDSSYEILALDTTTVIMKTPAQGEILRSTGTTGVSANGKPDLLIAGSVNIDGTGVAESVLQDASNFNGEAVLGVDWIYSSFIEAPGEKGAASTAIAIGANTGKTAAGQIGIVTADSATTSSVVPFIFSSSGAVPDVTNAYDIGSSTFKYKDIYATTFYGTATEAYYADLAENYLADSLYEPGTVLVFGGEEEITTTEIKGDRKVAGIVSTNPAHLMNSALSGLNVTALALQGRVPCKVIGKVEKGDLLVTSAIAGYAIVNNDPSVGTVIGKAVGSKQDGDRGIVEIVVGKH